MNTKPSEIVTKGLLFFSLLPFNLTYDTHTQTCSRLIRTATPPGITNLYVLLLTQMNTKLCTGIPTQVLVHLKQEVSVGTQFNEVCEHSVFLPMYVDKQQVSKELNMSTSRSGKLIRRIPCRILQAFQH